jgi:hypothetical protein
MSIRDGTRERDEVLDAVRNIGVDSWAMEAMKVMGDWTRGK